MIWDVDVYQLRNGRWAYLVCSGGASVNSLTDYRFRKIAKNAALREVQRLTWAENHRLRFQVQVVEGK